MKQLIKQELYRWLNKKGFLLLFCIGIGCTLFYQFYYQMSYVSYAQTKTQQFQQEINKARSYSQIYENNSKAAKDEETKKLYELQMDIWAEEFNYASSLKNLWGNNSDGSYDANILKEDKGRDNNLLRYEEHNLQPEDAYVYRDTLSDLKNRIQAREAYDTLNMQQKVIDIVPDVHYVIYHLLSGSDASILLVLIIVCFLNFKVWTTEYENQTYKLLFTQPYTRGYLLFSKLVSQIFITLVVYAFIIGTLCVNAFFIHGVGSPSLLLLHATSSYVTTSSLLINFFFHQVLFMITFIIILYSISLCTKKTEISLLLAFMLLIFGIFSSLDTSVNLFNVYQVENIVSNTHSISQSLILVSMVITCVSFVLFDYFYIKRCDLKSSE
ncbi:ABC transporter permease [Amedibacillus sp. YH-ame10]